MSQENKIEAKKLSPTTDFLPSDGASCSPLPPIRTVEDFRASAANWEGAIMVSTASDDPWECHRANVALIREERRMDEARHLFEFDEEGDLIGLSTCSAWVVQRWSQYKLGHAPFAHDADADQEFTSETAAMEYERAADSGFGGDTRYRYVVIPLPNV